MSQENVEVVRQALRAMDQGLDRVAEFWDPDIDWRAIEGAPDDIGVFKGRGDLAGERRFSLAERDGSLKTRRTRAAGHLRRPVLH